MLGFLRLVRGFCGLVFALQVLGAFGTLLTLSQVENISPNDETSVFAFVFIKIIIAVVFGFPYFYLRKVINNRPLAKLIKWLG